MNSKTEIKQQIETLEILNKDFISKYPEGSRVQFSQIIDAVYGKEDQVTGNYNCTSYDKRNGSKYKPNDWQDITCEEAIEICKGFDFAILSNGACLMVFNYGEEKG
ncbi:MAG: hypothetical protein M3R36_19315 [Bacteroidota bacterium]|nr:hypothetical protein [Bacteroidota bacterium]